jgi:hypothetical protein
MTNKTANKSSNETTDEMTKIPKYEIACDFAESFIESWYAKKLPDIDDKNARNTLSKFIGEYLNGIRNNDRFLPEYFLYF